MFQTFTRRVACGSAIPVMQMLTNTRSITRSNNLRNCLVRTPECLATSLVDTHRDLHCRSIHILHKEGNICDSVSISPPTRCLMKTHIHTTWRQIAQRTQHNFSSENKRQVRKGALYKHYPSSHFTRLRHLRYAFRKILQRNARCERKRLSVAKAKMRKRVEEGVEKMRDIVSHMVPCCTFIFLDFSMFTLLYQVFTPTGTVLL